jgi:hypothetical protein
MSRKKMPTSKPLTLVEVAEKYQVTDSGVLKWKKEILKLGMPWTWEGIERYRALQKTDPSADMAEMKRQKLQREVQRLDIKIERERGELVPKVEVQEACIRIISIWCSELDALVADLPGQIGGLSETDMSPKLRSRIELLKRNCKTAFKDL